MDDQRASAEAVIEASRQMSGLHLSNITAAPPGAPSKYTVGSIQFNPTAPPVHTKPYFDGRIAPGIGSASKTTIDLGPLKDALVVAIAALVDLHEKLSATPS